LARTKEALVSREQEVGELKSRVKELEDIHGKVQRLLSMKDSELAALQDKLKKLQAQAAAATATPPAAPAAGNAAKPPPSKAQSAANGKPAAKITAKDIWGDINAGEKTSPAANTSPQPAETAAASKPETAGVPATSTTSVANVSAPAAAMAGSATQQPANAQAKPENPPAHTPAKATPVKPKRASKPRPIPPPPTPWYMNTNVLYGGGAILLLAGLILLMRLIRRPKLQPRPATSTAGLEAGFDMPAEDTTLAEEQDMLDRLSRNPADSEAAVELLSLYYANGDAEKFEPVAEDMYAHIADPNQPEWQQVRAMGEELCPHNPLFGGPDDLAATAAYTHEELDHGTTQAIQTEPAAHLDTGLHEDDAQTLEQSFDLGSAQESAPEEPSHDEDEGFDFDLTEHAAPEPAPAPASAEPATAASEELVQSEAQTIPTGEPLPDLPPLEMESSTADDHVAEPAFEPAPVHEETSTPAEEELIASEDAIGTKLDLAKAYLDMGDPEGARSMLDEVMAEGNDAQKDEARKLLDEIH